MSEQRNLSREITVWPGLLNGLWPFPSSHKCAIATLAQRKKLQAVRVVRGSYKLLQGVRNTEVFLFFPCCLFFLIMNIHLLFLYFGCTMWPVVYLVPQPVIKSTPPALKHGALTVGPPGKSPEITFIYYLFMHISKMQKHPNIPLKKISTSSFFTANFLPHRLTFFLSSILIWKGRINICANSITYEKGKSPSHFPSS